jgi:hypothetical protein
MSRWFPVGMFFLVDSFLPSECFNSWVCYHICC